MSNKVIDLFFNNPLNKLLHIVYPDLCQVCGVSLTIGEEFLCIKCQHHLPQTMFYMLNTNPVERKFWGRQPIEKGTAIFYYHKSNSIQRLLHRVKYDQKEKLCAKLGRIFAIKLKEINYFEGIDVIIPVPLHKKKLRQRGFNQCSIFAQELSTASGIDYDDNILQRTRSNKSQTKMTRFERWKNTSGLFNVENASKLNAKNILLIDDVITTGSTLDACIDAILQKTNAKITLAAFAFSD